MNFKDFIKERELSRTSCSNDYIIQNYRFTNINRNHDFGTKLLFDNISDEFQQNVRTMVGYRFYGSPRDYFTAPVKKISSRAYQTPRMVKGQTPYVVSGIVTEFISKNLKQEQLSGLRIRDVADILIQQCIDATNNDIMFVFHCNEIAKDLSCIYPDLISPLSECYVGRGAVYGLEAMKGKLPSSIPLRGKGTIKWTNDNAHTIRELQFGDWSFCDIEHALCEYGKYRRVVVTGKGAKKRPPKNISYDLFGNLIVDK